MNEYTDHAVVDLDEAGSIIANKNIKIDYLNQKIAAAEARIAELEAENEQLSLYKQLADEYGLSVFADLAELQKQRDELLSAAEAIEIDAEECLDFDECTAMLVSIDDYHKLVEAITSVKEKPSVQD